jgi:hypothetical protein
MSDPPRYRPPKRYCSGCPNDVEKLTPRKLHFGEFARAAPHGLLDTVDSSLCRGSRKRSNRNWRANLEGQSENSDQEIVQEIGEHHFGRRIRCRNPSVAASQHQRLCYSVWHQRAVAPTRKSTGIRFVRCQPCPNVPRVGSACYTTTPAAMVPFSARGRVASHRCP